MGVKNIPGQGQTPPMPSREVGGPSGPAAADAATQTRSAEARAQPPLPPAGATVQDKRSPLSGVIRDGLKQLAQAEGWTAQKKSLDVLVGAMMTQRPAAAEAKPARPDAMSQMAFEKLLAGRADPAGRAAAKQDGAQLAQLALVALGTEGLAGHKRGDQEAQLKSDLAEVHGALADVVESADPAATDRLGKLAGDLEWVAGVLGRSSATQTAQPRVDAVAAMLKLLLKYV